MSAEPVAEAQLPENLKKLFLKALAATEQQNHGYAISILQNVMKEEPAFLDGRKLLRHSAVQKSKKDEGKRKGLVISGGFMKVKGKLKKDPKEAIIEIEKKLEEEPHSVEGNELLHEAALAAGMPLTAAFALETIRESGDKDKKTLAAMHKLAEHYLTHGEAEKAAQVYTDIDERDPTDGGAAKKGRDASAQASMKKGGWGQEDDYRKMLRNVDEAESLEKESRTGMTQEQMESQLESLGAQYAEDPNNLDVVRKIADLYERLERWEDAKGYFEWAFSLSEADSSLHRKVEEMADKLRAQEIKDLENDLEEAEENPDTEQKRDQLESMRREQAEQRIEEAKARVERNPTDHQLRFELGEYLFDGGHYTEAIPELQRSKSNPSIRIKAMLMLGKCCEKKNMLDIATTHFSDAIDELHLMDNTKKDALYNLGLVYERMDDKEKYLNCMKEIYNADYGYRDVAQRVEQSYGDK